MFRKLPNQYDQARSCLFRFKCCTPSCTLNKAKGVMLRIVFRLLEFFLNWPFLKSLRFHLTLLLLVDWRSNSRKGFTNQADLLSSVMIPSLVEPNSEQNRWQYRGTLLAAFFTFCLAILAYDVAQRRLRRGYELAPNIQRATKTQ